MSVFVTLKNMEFERNPGKKFETVLIFPQLQFQKLELYISKIKNSRMYEMFLAKFYTFLCI